MNKTHLVIGSKGEVGSALMALLSEKYNGCGIDVGSDAYPQKFDVLHVCIPYYGSADGAENRSSFVPIVQKYEAIYGAPGFLTIVHSTVRVGTCEKLNAVHSPIRGVHPNLQQSLKAFVKYFGGPRAQEAADIFNALGIDTRVIPDSRNTEAMKLWDTTGYGLNIILQKAIWQYCQENKLNFDVVYTDANRTYNEGFRALDMEQFAKYELKHVDGPIGGHCVVPNCNLLGGEIAEFVKAQSAKQPVPEKFTVLSRGC
jgi:hypothetical protein